MVRAGNIDYLPMNTLVRDLCYSRLVMDIPMQLQVDLTEQLGSLACVGPGRGGVGSRDSTEN